MHQRMKKWLIITALGFAILQIAWSCSHKEPTMLPSDQVNQQQPSSEASAPQPDVVFEETETGEIIEEELVPITDPNQLSQMVCTETQQLNPAEFSKESQVLCNNGAPTPELQALVAAAYTGDPEALPVQILESTDLGDGFSNFLLAFAIKTNKSAVTFQTKVAPAFLEQPSSQEGVTLKVTTKSEIAATGGTHIGGRVINTELHVAGGLFGIGAVDNIYDSEVNIYLFEPKENAFLVTQKSLQVIEQQKINNQFTFVIQNGAEGSYAITVTQMEVANNGFHNLAQTAVVDSANIQAKDLQVFATSFQ